MEGLTSNPGASRWIVSSPGPGLVKHQVKSQKKQQLLQEAASMTPDASALAQQLGLQDLSAADSVRFGGELNSSLNEYMTNYKENPYYAFSREGIQKVRDMQNLVRDPRINAAKQAHKATAESYKQKSEEGLGGYTIVRNGNLVILDKETGNLREVSPDNLDPTRHVVPTYKEAHDYLTTKRGFFDQKVENIKSLDNHMANPEEVIDQYNKWFQGIGSTQQEALKGLISQKTTSNSQQIRSRVKAIMSSTGLPQNVRDTIYAQYYTKELADGRVPTKKGAEDALYETVINIASGHDVFKQDVQANPALEGAAAQKSLTEVSPLVGALSGVNANSVKIPLTNSDTGRNILIDARPLQTNILDKVRPGAVYKNDENISQPKRNIADMSVFSLTDMSQVGIPNLYNGEIIHFTSEEKSLLGEMVVNNTSLHAVGIKRDDSGKVYLHGTNDKLEATPKNSQHAFMMEVMLPGNRTLGYETGGSDKYQNIFDKLTAAGWSATPISSAEYDAWKKQANNPDMEEPFGGSPDNAFKFKILVPFNPDQMNELYNLPVSYTGKDFNTIDFPEAMPSSNNSATQDPAKGNPFSTFGDL